MSIHKEVSVYLLTFLLMASLIVLFPIQPALGVVVGGTVVDKPSGPHSLTIEFVRYGSNTAPNGNLITNVEIQYSFALHNQARGEIEVVAKPSNTVVYKVGHWGDRPPLGDYVNIAVPDGTTAIEIYAKKGSNSYHNTFTLSKFSITYGPDVASEESTLAAKMAAERAEQSANIAKEAATSVLNQVNHTTHGLSKINTNILNLDTDVETLKNELNQVKNTINDMDNYLKGNTGYPIIYYMKGRNGQTATKTTYINLDVTASNVTHYRIENGAWTLFNGGNITVNNIQKGINRIEVEFGCLKMVGGTLQGESIKMYHTIFGL